MKRYILLFVVMLVGVIEAQWLPVNIKHSFTSPVANNFIYADSKMAIFSTGSNYIFKSFDNGVIWMVDWFNPAEKPKMLSGTYGGHLMFVGENFKSYFHSTNRGGSWEKVITNVQSTEATVDIEGGRNDLFFIALTKSIYRKPPSNDWLSKLTLPLTETETIKSLNSFKTTGELFFTTSKGRLLRSTNDGTNWNEVANFNTEIPILETYGDKNIVLMGKRGSQRTLYFSLNNGILWDSLPISFNCVELHMTSPGRGFARADSYELYYTTDSMKTWRKHLGLKMMKGTPTSGDKGIMISASFEVYTTSNAGENWDQLSELDTKLINDIEILADNSAYALTLSGKLYRSANFGSTWSLIQDSLPYPLDKLTRETDTSFLAYSARGFVLRYSNSSGKFTDMTQFYPAYHDRIYNYNGILYVALHYYNFSYSSDYGLTWTTKPLPYNKAVPFFFAFESNFYIPSYGGRYYVSTDRGNSWDSRYLPTNGSPNIVFIYRNQNRMWACDASSKMFVSTNAGQSWSLGNSVGTSAAFYPHQNMWVMQLISSEITQTTDEGRTWKRTLHFPEVINIASIKLNPPDFGLMLDVNGSMYRMHNGGVPVELTSFNAEVVPKGVLLKWETATETNNYGFFVQRKNNGIWSDLVFISGMGTTLNPSSYSFLDEIRPDKGDTNYYRLKQVDLSGEFSFSKEVAIGFTPYTIELDQNYPNPFSTASENGNNETIIRFRLPEEGETKLTVYDTQGRVVEEVHNGSLPAGEHSFAFPSKVNSPASGAYFYELRFNGKIKRGKMLLLR